MKRFVCTVCGYIYEGVNAPQECPICHQSGEKFKETSLDSSEANTTYSKIKEGADIPSTELSYDNSLYRIDESCR